MYREAIDAFIDAKKEEMLEDLKKLVRINSVRGEASEGKPYGSGPAMVLKQAGELMEAYGFSVTNYDNYCVTGDLLREDKALDILAHLDVVPVTDEWTVTGPFEPVVKDGRIYGRGTSDDKGPAVAALYAMRAVRELDIPLKHGVRLILGSDEECGSSDLDHYYAVEQEARFTFTPDADFPLINLEKARLEASFEADLSFAETDGGARVLSLEAGDKVNVVPAKARAVLTGISAEKTKACWEALALRYKEKQISASINEEDGRVTILVKGQAAHASTPAHGENAITVLLELLSRLPLAAGSGKTVIEGLAALFPHGDTCGEALGIKMEDEASGALTMNLGILKIDGGRLFGDFDVRAPLCASDENVTKVIRDKLAGAGIVMDASVMKAAHYVSADSPLVRTLLGSYEKYFGKKGEPMAIGGGTYVHGLARGVAFGCAVDEVDNHMHGDDEFMEVGMLVKSAKIFADAIVNLCNMD